MRRWIEGSGDLVGGRFGRHQTCESVLLNTLRYRHHYRLLVVDALDPCDGACYCLDVSRSTLPQSTFVCPSDVDVSPCSSAVLPCAWWSVDGGYGCLDPACSCHVRCRVRVKVLFLLDVCHSALPQ